MWTNSKSNLLVIYDSVKKLSCVLNKFRSSSWNLNLCRNSRCTEWLIGCRTIKLILKSRYWICFLQQWRHLDWFSCNSLLNVIILCFTVVHLCWLWRCIALEITSAIWLRWSTCILAINRYVVLVLFWQHLWLIKLSASII